MRGAVWGVSLTYSSEVGVWKRFQAYYNRYSVAWTI